ncbi:MAG: acyl-ACP desaturase [Acidobacteriota bacterium]
MSVSAAYHEKMYRAYHEFFDIAERKRRWHPFRDIPWEKLDKSKNSEATAICVETFCGVELYVPDYTANGFNMTRTIFGHAWFEANWGYEESKHGLTFREYLLQSGMRTPEQYAAYEQTIFSKVWNLPFNTRRQMTCYGVLQEAATYLIYEAQKKKAREEGDELLEQIFFFISRDEAAHHGFYKKVLIYELEDDREGTLADMAHVVFNFNMPGVNLIPEYQRRLLVDGVGITPQHFLQRGIFPLLKSVGTSRQELIRIYSQNKRKTTAAIPQESPLAAAG